MLIQGAAPPCPLTTIPTYQSLVDLDQRTAKVGVSTHTLQRPSSSLRASLGGFADAIQLWPGGGGEVECVAGRSSPSTSVDLSPVFAAMRDQS